MGLRRGITVVSLVAVTAVPALGQGVGAPGPSVLAGSRVFGAKGCIGCHAINGLGGTAGPDLAAARERKSFYDFAAAMWNHMPGMVAVMEEREVQPPQLDPWEAADLVAFLFWVDYFDPPGRAERGARLFAERGCAGCHRIGGEGGEVGPNLDLVRHFTSPIQLASAMWNHAAGMVDTMRARNVARPELLDGDLNDLMAHLKSAADRMPGEPAHVVPGEAIVGRQLFTERGCTVCHRVRGVGGAVGPDLAERASGRGLAGFAAAMWNKAPAMLAAMEERGIAPPSLSPEDMSHIVAYLYSVRYFADAGNPELGRAVVRTKGCLDCHSLDSETGTPGGDLTVARLRTPQAVVAALWNHAALGGDPDRRWPTITPAEMSDLAAYFEDVSGSQ